jgi:acetyltransferase-like isoleucine patch superfamily enzyme
MILPGVTIERDSFVGIGSVVHKDVSTNTIVAGNPAKFIKLRFEESE